MHFFRIGGVGFEQLAKESLERHKLAFTDRECDAQILRNPGFFHYRTGGEKHVNDPDSIAALQEATKHNNKSAYDKYVDAAMKTVRDCTLRGQLDFVTNRDPIEVILSCYILRFDSKDKTFEFGHFTTISGIPIF